MITEGILKPEGDINIITKNGDTNDIISAIMKVVLDDKAVKEVDSFVRDNVLQADEISMIELFEFVRDAIQYEEDEHKQYAQYPSNLWHGKSPTGTPRAGDCKSKTAFIVACLLAIQKQSGGIRAIAIRFCTYSKSNKNVTHVYPIALIDKGVFILDSVYGYFNEQKTPKYKTTDKVLIINPDLDYKSILRNL